MEDPGRLGFQHWAIDHNHLQEHLRDHPALKLMDVISERDAAILDRNTAIADKKTAFAERDAALLQRDVAYADRNSALMERDAAVAALAMVRADTDLRQGNATEAASKLMHMVNMAVGCPLMESDLHPVPRGNSEMVNSLDGKQSRKQKKRVRKVSKDNPRKRKIPLQTSQDPKGSKSSSKKRQKLKQLTSLERNEKLEKPKQEQREKCTDLIVYNCATFSIPYCSCTGINQQCYRWGNGGWQSACCTNFISMYPLPMNPKKRSSRIPGRKMSGSAFKKLLERLAAEGVNISCPVDLKNHWAKHGTNRYVTIK